MAFLDAFNECQTFVKVTENVIEKNHFYYCRQRKIELESRNDCILSYIDLDNHIIGIRDLYCIL